MASFFARRGAKDAPSDAAAAPAPMQPSSLPRPASMRSTRRSQHAEDDSPSRSHSKSEPRKKKSERVSAPPVPAGSAGSGLEVSRAARKALGVGGGGGGGGGGGSSSRLAPPHSAAEDDAPTRPSSSSSNTKKNKKKQAVAADVYADPGDSSDGDDAGSSENDVGRGRGGRGVRKGEKGEKGGRRSRSKGRQNSDDEGKEEDEEEDVDLDAALAKAAAGMEDDDDEEGRGRGSKTSGRSGGSRKGGSAAADGAKPARDRSRSKPSSSSRPVDSDLDDDDDDDDDDDMGEGERGGRRSARAQEADGRGGKGGGKGGGPPTNAAGQALFFHPDFIVLTLRAPDGRLVAAVRDAEGHAIPVASLRTGRVRTDADGIPIPLGADGQAVPLGPDGRILDKGAGAGGSGGGKAPVPMFTYCMVAGCLAGFALSLWQTGGIAPLADNPTIGPSATSLVACGAKVAVLIRGPEQQWWRLLSPLWLHAGAIHLVGNLSLLWRYGAMLEATAGTARYAALYVLSGIYSIVISSAFAPGAITVGASGAIFGLFGAFLAELFQNYHLIPTAKERLLAFVSLGFSIALNLAIGLLPFVDNFAHVGGLAAGLMLGFPLLVYNRGGGGGAPGASMAGGKCTAWQYLLGAAGVSLYVVSLGVGLLAVSEGWNATALCPNCKYVSCVPTPWWACPDMSGDPIGYGPSPTPSVTPSPSETPRGLQVTVGPRSLGDGRATRLLRGGLAEGENGLSAAWPSASPAPAWGGGGAGEEGEGELGGDGVVVGGAAPSWSI